MATLKPELKAILEKYGINPRDTSQIWDCHGTLVLYHKAYEIIAAKENITFDFPLALESNGPAKSVAICVTGHMGDRKEWSIGEASPANNKNAYPYAMAEKRAKDRVIAKLVGLAQYVYSEDEADEFKEAKPEPKQSDWPAFITQFKSNTESAASFRAARELWTEYREPLAALKKADATAYYDLVKWCQAKAETKPKDAA